MSGTQTTAASSWFDAFPLDVAAQAATAICKSWKVLVSKPSHFHGRMKEPALTKAIKIHVEHVTAREVGLLGMWAAETIIGVIDSTTGQVTQERRTDITFGWNDTSLAIQLVFEFKKLNRKAGSRAAYVGPSGMGRFVDGIYSKGQPVAAMVGMMLDSYDKIVPDLIKTLESSASILALKSVVASGKVCQMPSTLFSEAEFDTGHTRPTPFASSHGTIRIAHFFLPF